ncbi:MAG TPA: GNAT family N-acetyltransferase, partial [Jiangellaceae bacterium]|nr:GNAT family N-acetyltransferase [Jiangellaceae bacterium]
LGRRPDPRNAAFFGWKHYENAFGASPAWVALDGDRIVGLRTLMRWEFDTPDGLVRAVRAVDTATHPDHQGRGIFSALTLQAIDELRAEGVDFVFNTPNDKSRPGYLKMGWQPVGRLPTGLRPASLRAVPRIAAARVPADLWSTGSDAGLPAAEALADEAAVTRLLDTTPRANGVATRRTSKYLRWRYGFEPLAYRAMLAGSSAADGMLLFRLRRRGSATELAVADLMLPEPSATAARRLIRAALRATGADYALGLRTVPANGLLPLPGQGPMLTWRALTADTMPTLDRWQLSLGDIELF